MLNGISSIQIELFMQPRELNILLNLPGGCFSTWMIISIISLAIFWKAGWLLIPMFYLLLILLYRKSDWPGKLAAFAWCIGFAASIFLSKTNEATSSVYFSGGRMFLAWPLILIAVSGILFSDLLREKWVKHLIPIVCGIVILKAAIFPYVIPKSASKQQIYSPCI